MSGVRNSRKNEIMVENGNIREEKEWDYVIIAVTTSAGGNNKRKKS